MRTKYIIITCVLLCIGFPSVVQAQLIPGPDRVNAILDQINSCKDGLEEVEKELEQAEKNPEDLTYAEYLALQNAKKRIKTCLAAARAKLDELRKEYPGWFNQASTTSQTPVDLGHGESIKAAQLEKIAAKIDKAIHNFIKRIDAVPQPEH